MSDENEVEETEVIEETQEVAEVETEEAETEVVEETEEDKKKNYQSKVDKRFAKMTSDKYASERRIAELEAELKTTQIYASPQQQQVQEEADTKPDPLNFETTEDYVDALTDWKVDKKFEAQSVRRTAQKKKDSEAQSQNELQNNFIKAQTIASEKYNDYNEATADLNIDIFSDLGQNLLKCGNSGPDIMYFICKNPEEKEKMFRLKGMDLSLEIGKLREKLAAPMKKKKTNAPAPISASRGSKKTTGKVNLNDVSPADFYKAQYG